MQDKATIAREPGPAIAAPSTLPLINSAPAGAVDELAHIPAAIRPIIKSVANKPTPIAQVKAIITALKRCLDPTNRLKLLYLLLKEAVDLDAIRKQISANTELTSIQRLSQHELINVLNILYCQRLEFLLQTGKFTEACLSNDHFRLLETLRTGYQVELLTMIGNVLRHYMLELENACTLLTSYQNLVAPMLARLQALAAIAKQPNSKKSISSEIAKQHEALQMMLESLSHRVDILVFDTVASKLLNSSPSDTSTTSTDVSRISNSSIEEKSSPETSTPSPRRWPIKWRIKQEPVNELPTQATTPQKRKQAEAMETEDVAEDINAIDADKENMNSSPPTTPVRTRPSPQPRSPLTPVTTDSNDSKRACVTTMSSDKATIYGPGTIFGADHSPIKFCPPPLNTGEPSKPESSSEALAPDSPLRTASAKSAIRRPLEDLPSFAATSPPVPLDSEVDPYAGLPPGTVLAEESLPQARSSRTSGLNRRASS